MTSSSRSALLLKFGSYVLLTKIRILSLKLRRRPRKSQSWLRGFSSLTLASKVFEGIDSKKQLEAT